MRNDLSGKWKDYGYIQWLNDSIVKSLNPLSRPIHETVAFPACLLG
jgi:hypothetical protein